MHCPICKHPFDLQDHIRCCSCCGDAVFGGFLCSPDCQAICSTCWDNLDYFRDQVRCQRAKEK